MQIIVALREGADREAFKVFLGTQGLAFTEFEFLPRIFEVEVGDSPSVVMVYADAECYDESDNTFHGGGNFPPTGTQQALDIEVPSSDTTYGYSDTWSLHRIVRGAGGAIRSLPTASSFNCYRSGVGVDIYIVDSGVNAAHPDLVGRAAAVDGSTDVWGHGTECATLAGGTKFGSAKDALIWGAQGLSSNGSGTTSALTAAVNAALSHYQGRAALNRPAVMNLSWYNVGSDAFSAVVASVIAAGIVVCACAGNNSADITVSGHQTYPASDANVICVACSNMVDGFAYESGSNWGSRVDVLAPGDMTRSGWLNYCHTSGATSAATAVTTGVVACMLQGYARLTGTAQVQAVVSYLKAQAQPLTINNISLWPNTTNKGVYLDPSATPTPIPGLSKVVMPDPKGYSSKGICPIIGLVVPATSVCHEVPHPPGITYPLAAGVSSSVRASVVS